MATNVKDLFSEKVAWKGTEDPLHPYAAEIEGEVCVVRVNDFPEEHLYTLISNGEEVADFDDWPAPWTRLEEQSIEGQRRG